MRQIIDTASLANISALPPGPLALVLNEDDFRIDSTLAHLRRQGFAAIVAVSTRERDHDSADLDITCPPKTTLPDIVTAAMPALAGRWLMACYNGEYFYYPFCEDRNVADLAQFVAEERREAVFTTVVDLYPRDVATFDAGLSDEEVMFDWAGYYAADRWSDGQALDRQIDLFGGLKWRFAEHIPWSRQRIDRVALFRARADLVMDAEHRLSDPEMNTLACPWHHSLTCAMASFRVAKSLLRNPGSTFDIDSFVWDQSRPFAWRSGQLMQAGLMEPGQWF